MVYDQCESVKKEGRTPRPRVMGRRKTSPVKIVGRENKVSTLLRRGQETLVTETDHLVAEVGRGRKRDSHSNGGEKSWSRRDNRKRESYV